jgi:transposase
MAHRLKMATVEAIHRLHSLGWSQRRIARELGIHRETVSNYLSRRASGAKPAISPAGSSGSKPATFPDVPAPTEERAASTDRDDQAAVSKPAISPPGSGGSQAGRRSECQPLRQQILDKLELGLSAQRIYQDLVQEHGFTASYDSVKRFVRRLGRKLALPMRRVECDAGQEAQVDFGTGAPIISPDGRRRKTHVFRIVLSHSRKGYCEARFRQTTDDFIACLESAFRHFGGAPRTLIIDNLKAAVKHPDWFDPELTPKLEAFCRHYGIVILPTRPRMPRHKGKVERGVGYVQDNGLKARRFTTLEEQNRHLLDWEAHVADKRIHGTTRMQVGKIFLEVEKPALLPLPLERFAFFHEAQRKVSRDGHVEVAKAYYSAPPEYLGRTVWVRWDARLVRLFNDRFEQIAIHVRHEQGRFSTQAQHVPREKISGLERGAAYLLRKIESIGLETHQWAQAMLQARGIEGTRVLMGLIHLAGRHPSAELETACKTALSYHEFRLRSLRELLKRQAAEQRPLPFLDEHPLIRPLGDYGRLVAARLEHQPAAPERFGRHDWTKECLKTQQRRPADDQRGATGILPPRPGYPSPGCSPAEPDSVSPDDSSVIPFPSRQELEDPDDQ